MSCQNQHDVSPGSDVHTAASHFVSELGGAKLTMNAHLRKEKLSHEHAALSNGVEHPTNGPRIS